MLRSGGAKEKNRMHFYGAANVLLNISLKYQSLSPYATQALIEGLKIRQAHTHTRIHSSMCKRRRRVDLIRSLGLRA